MEDLGATLKSKEARALDPGEPQKLSFDDVCRIFGYDYCKKTIFKELEESASAQTAADYENMSTSDLEALLYENINFIQCVLNQYCACKLARE